MMFKYHFDVIWVIISDFMAYYKIWFLRIFEISEMFEILCVNVVDDFGISENFPLLKKFKKFQRQKKKYFRIFFFFLLFFVCLPMKFVFLVLDSCRASVWPVVFLLQQTKKTKLKKNQLLIFSRARKNPILMIFGT